MRSIEASERRSDDGLDEFEQKGSNAGRCHHTYSAVPSLTALLRVGGLTQSLADTVTYTYDNLDRLTAAVTTNTVDDRAWTLDAHGNWTQTDINNTIVSYGYNDADQLCWTITGTQPNSDCTAPAGATGYTYDTNGNHTTNTNGTVLDYNHADQTTSINTAGTEAEYDYADTDQSVPRTRTVGSSTTDYLFTLTGLAAERTGTATTTYIREPGGAPIGIVDNTGRTGWYLKDALGSVTAIIDNNGDETNRYRYTPYGQVTETNPAGTAFNNPIQYASGRTDPDTALTRFGTRWYQPEHGRWTQPDPTGQPNGPNRYLYVGSSPTNRIDPTGLFGISFGGCSILCVSVNYDSADGFGASFGAGPALGAGLSFSSSFGAENSGRTGSLDCGAGPYGGRLEGGNNGLAGAGSISLGSQLGCSANINF